MLALLLIQLTTAVEKNWREARANKIANDELDPDEARKLFQVMKNERDLEETEPITILEWWKKKHNHVWVGGDFDGPPKQMTRLPTNCGGCYWTNDRHEEKTANALIIDNLYYLGRHYWKGETKPKYKSNVPNVETRNPNQYWIWYAREAASKGIDVGLAEVGNLYDRSFNLTLSYRRDSDIPFRYGSIDQALLDARFMKVLHDDSSLHYKEIETGEENIASIMALKTNPNGMYATWLVSNCDETEGAKIRFKYAQDLVSIGLKLDGFGTCFDRPLQKMPFSVRGKENGVQFVKYGALASYKFYLAFENSVHCNDYISEKFWRNSLDQGLVPVVMGPHPDDLAAIAPPHSFIHVEDFKSNAALVDYLDYLDGNDTAYAEYHQWRLSTPKTDYDYMPKSNLEFKCHICTELQRLRQLENPRKTIKSVAKWWWLELHDEQCTLGANVTVDLSSLESDENEIEEIEEVIEDIEDTIESGNFKNDTFKSIESHLNMTKDYLLYFGEETIYSPPNLSLFILLTVSLTLLSNKKFARCLKRRLFCY